eukprot:525588_1
MAHIGLNLPSQGKNFSALFEYLKLAQGSKIQVEYIWIGGSGLDLRCKTKTMPHAINSVKDLPIWNYDGSSTNQAAGHDSEVYLKPVKIVPDPFRGGDNLLCLCETLDPKTMRPIETNKRADAAKIFESKSVKEEETWFGIEQEYTLFGPDGFTPLGWPTHGFPAPQGPYYCSVGADNSFGRHIAEAHYKACLYAGIDISGINAEVMPGQWEFQVGPCTGIDSGDQLWLARYMLHRVAEDFGVIVSFDPKPVKGDWNGAGAHCNYSTKSMRSKGGYKCIIDAVQRLEKKHDEHMAVYGKDNKRRLTGKHETANWETFKYGVADRGASIRIPRQAEMDQKGYFEDRRPAANCDPYLVTSMIAKTTLLDEIYPQDVETRSKKEEVVFGDDEVLEIE